MFVELSSYEIALADELSHRLDTQSWNDSRYSRGILNSARDPRKAERIGIYGEIAFAKAASLKADLRRKKGGDKHDFLLQTNGGFKRTVDIKMLSKPRETVLVRSHNDSGIPKQLKDVYVFGLIVPDRGVDFLGCKGKESILELGPGFIKPSPVETMLHRNYEIPLHMLSPVTAVLDYIDHNCRQGGFEICY